jgi:hypothetical protein
MRGDSAATTEAGSQSMVDNDHPDQRGRQAGQEAATECWRRWKAAGREVLAFSTNKPGTDIADINGEDRHNG